MAVTKIKPVKSTLSKALDYIENPDKTDNQMLISSFGCSYETADIEFGYTLSQARDKGNNLAFHLIQSFAPGEVDYQKAHEIGRQLADAVTKGQHEYVLTTHIDKGHIHNHIIFCAVNFVDHHKYVSNKRTYYGIRNMSDKLCRDNGLSVVVPGKGSKGKSYAEYQAEKTGTSWKGKLKIAVDALIPQVSDFEELLQRLQAAGYEIKPGKYVSCRAPGQERFTRLKTLGADYTEEAIKERIAGKRTRAAKAPKAERRGVNLLIDIENSIKAQQSRGYEQWAKIHNLKQAAKTMNFLTENKIEQYADLLTRIEEITAASEQAGDSLKNVEKRLSDMAVLIKNVTTCAACCSGVFSKAASRARLLIRFCFPVAAFTSIAPSRLIFCVILSRALYCFMVVHLQTAPPKGRKADKIICGLRAAHFLRLCRHYPVQLGIFREAVYKGQNDVAIE